MYMHTYIRTYICTCIHTYIRTYICTFIHTYVRTYVVNVTAVVGYLPCCVERRTGGHSSKQALQSWTGGGGGGGGGGKGTECSTDSEAAPKGECHSPIVGPVSCTQGMKCSHHQYAMEALHP